MNVRQLSEFTQKLYSLTREIISEEKPQLEWKITNLLKEVTKCAYTFEMYYNCFTLPHYFLFLFSVSKF